MYLQVPREDAVARDVLKAGGSRGEPDGQADSFLRQKEVSAGELLKLYAHRTKAKAKLLKENTHVLS